MALNNNDEKLKLNNNINDNPNESKKLKNIFSNEIPEKDLFMMDENEIKKINEEIEKLKQNQKNEINSLERELDELKMQNAEYEIDEEKNNINLNDNMINKLKEDIINQIQPKLTEELKSYKSNIEEQLKKMDDNNQKEYIENCFNKIKHEVIIPEIGKIKKKLLNEKNLNQNPNNNEEIKRTEKKIIERKKIFIKGKDGKIKTLNISSVKEDNEINSHKNIKGSPNPYKNKNDNNINNIKVEEKKEENNNNNKKNNIELLNYKKNKEPVKVLINDLDRVSQNNLYQKKNSNEDLFPYFNNIFFNNKEQTSFKAEKIEEIRLNNLHQKYIKYKNERRQNYLINYLDNFLKTNVFKIFQRKSEDPHLLSIVRYNIEAILICFDLNRHTYMSYYFPDNNMNNIRDRKKSTDAAFQFRKVFNIDENIIKEEELLKKLDKNDNNIYKVFQQMYG